MSESAAWSWCFRSRKDIVEAGEIFEWLIDHPSWIERIRRYVSGRQGINGLLIPESFLTVRGRSGFIGMHRVKHVPLAYFTFCHPRTGD